MTADMSVYAMKIDFFNTFLNENSEQNVCVNVATVYPLSTLSQRELVNDCCLSAQLCGNDSQRAGNMLVS